MRLKDAETGERPAGRPGFCFYCGQAVGAEHGPDCVIPSRTVVIRLTVEMVWETPRSFSERDINFQLNESTFCAANLIRQLVKEEDSVGDDQCFMCHRARAEYVREATAEDHERLLPPGLQPEVELDQ